MTAKLLRETERALRAAGFEVIETDHFGNSHRRIVVARDGKTRRVTLSQSPANFDHAVRSTVREARRVFAALQG